jgi:hypothetical protein
MHANAVLDDVPFVSAKLTWSLSIIDTGILLFLQMTSDLSHEQIKSYFRTPKIYFHTPVLPNQEQSREQYCSVTLNDLDLKQSVTLTTVSQWPWTPSIIHRQNSSSMRISNPDAAVWVVLQFEYRFCQLEFNRTVLSCIERIWHIYSSADDRVIHWTWKE